MAGTSEKIQDTAESISDRASEAASRVSSRASDVAESLRDAGTQAGRMAQRQFGHLRDTASDYMDQGRQKAKQVSDTVESQIIEMPFTSILVAAGVGFLLGVLLNRR